MKRVFKIIKYTLFSIGSMLFMYFLLAFALSIISTSPEEHICDEYKEIYIKSNGVHLDIIIPKENLSADLKRQLNIREYVKYVSIGWGDKGFYLETPTWADLEFSTAFKAMFTVSESAIHITRYQGRYKHWNKIGICEDQLTQLTNYFLESFKRDSNEQIIEIAGSGYTRYDTFYEAKGSYSFIKTCNQWVNLGLKAADVQTSIWSPFDKGVLYQLEDQKLN